MFLIDWLNKRMKMLPPTDTLSARLRRLSVEMAEVAKELDGKYHLNAVELDDAAMFIRGWSREVEKDEEDEATE